LTLRIHTLDTSDPKNMQKSQRLATLLKLKEREEQSLAKKVAEIASLLSQEQSQLNELAEYKVEYLSDLDSLVSQTVSVSTLNNKQQFINKLDQAVMNQKNRLDQVQKEWDSRVQSWGRKKHEISVWERMIAEAKASEQLAKDKIQQKEMEDLHNSRRHQY